MPDDRETAVGRAGVGGCALATLGLAGLGVVQAILVAVYCVVMTQFEPTWFVFPLIWTAFWGLPGLAMLRAARRA
jgi:hypothetical protein